MKKFVIEVIPHAQQRYNTPADYTTDPESGVTTIRISEEIGNPFSIMAVAIHEMTEVRLCRLAGVTDEQIDAWDMSFDDRPDADDYPEPGNHPDAPYHTQHMVALKAERAYVEAMGMDWKRHDEAVLAVCE